MYTILYSTMDYNIEINQIQETITYVFYPTWYIFTPFLI